MIEPRACNCNPCHCFGSPAEYIVGPMANGNEYDASEKCALMHVMAGYASRKRQPEPEPVPEPATELTFKKQDLTGLTSGWTPSESKDLNAQPTKTDAQTDPDC